MRARQTIIDEIKNLLSVEETKLTESKIKNNQQKINLHQNKLDGLNSLVAELEDCNETEFNEIWLKRAIKKAAADYPLLTKGFTSKIKAYFKEIAPGWIDVPQSQLYYVPCGTEIEKKLQQNFDKTFKILLVGASTVGKSALLTQLTDSVFRDFHEPTTGVDFKTHVTDKTKFQIWDTSGDERFTIVTKGFFKNDMQAVVLIFDITNIESLDKLKSWEEHIVEKKIDLLKILVGAKSDLKSDRKVSAEEAENWATIRGMQYMEISSKENTNVDALFNYIAVTLRARLENKSSYVL